MMSLERKTGQKEQLQLWCRLALMLTDSMADKSASMPLPLSRRQSEKKARSDPRVNRREAEMQQLHFLLPYKVFIMLYYRVRFSVL